MQLVWKIMAGHAPTELPIFAIKSDHLTFHRYSTLVAIFVYLVWWFVVNQLLPHSFNPLPSRLAVCALFGALFILSFTSAFIKNHIEEAFTFCASILTSHYFYLFANNPNDKNWVVGTYITIIAVGATISGKHSLWVYSLLASVLSLYMTSRDYIDPLSLAGIFTVILLINLFATLRRGIDAERRLRQEEHAKKILSETLASAKVLFLAHINHEIRTPLTAIMGFNELLTSDQLPEQERSLYRERIDANCQLLLSMVEQMTILTDTVSMTIAKHEEPLNLRSFIDELVLSTQPNYSAKGLTLDVVYSKALPERVYVDKAHLACMLLNVLDNAIKFSSRGRIMILADCIIDSKHHAVLQIEVTDTGVGIQPEHWEYIFASFTQIESDYTRRYRGVGLGLTVARRLARLHHGDIRVVRSVVDQGTTIAITLPAPSVNTLS